MLATQEKRIGEHLYRVKQAPLEPARRGLRIVAKTLGSLLATLAGGLTNESAAKAVADFAARITDEDLETLTAIFAEHSQVALVEQDGEPVWVPLKAAATRNEAFGGHLLTYFEWLWFAIETNYSDFLDELRAAGLTQVAPTAKSR